MKIILAIFAIKKLHKVFLAALSVFVISSSVTVKAQAERPPQFVLIAFDNCTELDRWQEWADFLNDVNQDRVRILFTYFISGINFLADENRNSYKGPLPEHVRGYSPIGFGGSPDEVRKRVAFINSSKASGNEIGSHAVGHFYGESWSAAEWATEFENYKQLFRNVSSNNNFPEEEKFAFDYSAIVGFRAPQLSIGPGMYQTLRQLNFRYDTSENGDPAAWPVKEGGIWRFKLANIIISGSGKKTLSMDYNFFVAQSKAKDDPPNYELYREQMFRSYIDYFKSNYTGNRAPIYIGHHFANYQGGIYRAALKAFARSVCNLPDVRCVTYSELADFMDSLTPSTLRAYRNGEFQHAEMPELELKSALAKELPSLSIAVQGRKELRASLVGISNTNNAFVWELNKKRISDGPALAINRLPKRGTSSLTVILTDKAGQELSRQTENIRFKGNKVILLPPRETEQGRSK